MATESTEMFTDPPRCPPRRMTEQELSNICKWLGRIQRALVTALSVSDGETPILDPVTKEAILNVEALIRHLHAIKFETPMVTLSTEECKAIHELIDQLSGGNPESVFTWEDDSLHDPICAACVKIYREAGEPTPFDGMRDR